MTDLPPFFLRQGLVAGCNQSLTNPFGEAVLKAVMLSDEFRFLGVERLSMSFMSVLEHQLPNYRLCITLTYAVCRRLMQVTDD